jgi:hypothetical protein
METTIYLQPVWNLTRSSSRRATPKTVARLETGEESSGQPLLWQLVRPEEGGFTLEAFALFGRG